MAYIDPVDPVAHNTQYTAARELVINNNLRYLALRPSGYTCYQSALADYSYTGAWAAVDTTNLRLTVTPGITNQRVRLLATFSVVSGGAVADFDFLIDGATRLGGTSGLMQVVNGYNGPVTVIGQYTNLSLASHTFDLAWTTGGTAWVIKRSSYPITLLWAEY